MLRGLLWRWIFAHSFALINMEEDSPAVSGHWSPLSQSEDFSALLDWNGKSSKRVVFLDIFKGKLLMFRTFHSLSMSKHG